MLVVLLVITAPVYAQEGASKPFDRFTLFVVSSTG